MPPALDTANAPGVHPYMRTSWFQKVFATDLSGTTAHIGTPIRASSEPQGFVSASRHVSAEFMFYGKGADNATITGIRIYAVTLMGGPPAMDYRKLILYEPQLLVTVNGSTLLSTTVGIAGGFIDETYRFADTIPAITKSAYATYLEALTGRTIQFFNPADNLNIARIGIPDFGMSHGFVVDLEGGTATAMNCLMGLWT